MGNCIIFVGVIIKEWKDSMKKTKGFYPKEDLPTYFGLVDGEMYGANDRIFVYKEDEYVRNNSIGAYTIAELERTSSGMNSYYNYTISNNLDIFGVSHYNGYRKINVSDLFRLAGDNIYLNKKKKKFEEITNDVTVRGYECILLLKEKDEDLFNQIYNVEIFREGIDKYIAEKNNNNKTKEPTGLEAFINKMRGL